MRVGFPPEDIIFDSNVFAASGIIGCTFFATGNPVMETLYAWAGFAAGFGFRPLGAVLFGYLGDKLGRKYTFLITMSQYELITVLGRRFDRSWS